MIYAYRCTECSHDFDVIKSHTEYKTPENCPKCSIVAQKVFTIPQLLVKNEEPEYNPGLGCIVKNSAHRKEIAKHKGLIEVGNEKPETIHKDCDTILKEKLDRSYDD